MSWSCEAQVGGEKRPSGRKAGCSSGVPCSRCKLLQARAVERFGEGAEVLEQGTSLKVRLGGIIIAEFKGKRLKPVRRRG